MSLNGDIVMGHSGQELETLILRANYLTTLKVMQLLDVNEIADDVNNGELSVMPESGCIYFKMLTRLKE